MKPTPRKPSALIVQPDNDDALKGRQLTDQYHRATGGMKEVLVFGAMMMQLREMHPELAQKGPMSKSKSNVDSLKITLRSWLEKHAPDVKYATAQRFLAVTQSVSAEYAQIVGAKTAKLMPLPDLVTASAESLDKSLKAKQLELFEWVNGTSQKSWLDRFSPQSPQQRGRANRSSVKPRAKTQEELAQEAEDEINHALTMLNAWFAAGHQLRVKSTTRHTAEAALEGALLKLRAVK